jgi:hypothetical protein
MKLTLAGISRFLTAIEIATLLTGLAFPVSFVRTASAIFSTSGFVLAPPAAVAYGVLILGVLIPASILRKFAGVPHASTKLLVVDAMILVGAGIAFARAWDSPPGAALTQITTPYFAYALSVFFCAGVAYAAADLLYSLIFRNLK